MAFCILILYPATLLNTLTLVSFRCSCCFGIFQWIFYVIKSFVNKGSFILPFQFEYILFLPLSRNSNTILNRIKDSKHATHVPYLREKTISLSSLNMILVEGYYSLKKFLSILVCWMVWRGLEVEIWCVFSVSIEMIMWILFIDNMELWTKMCHIQNSYV